MNFDCLHGVVSFTIEQMAEAARGREERGVGRLEKKLCLLRPRPEPPEYQKLYYL